MVGMVAVRGIAAVIHSLAPSHSLASPCSPLLSPPAQEGPPLPPCATPWPRPPETAVPVHAAPPICSQPRPKIGDAQLAATHPGYP